MTSARKTTTSVILTGDSTCDDNLPFCSVETKRACRINGNGGDFDFDRDATVIEVEESYFAPPDLPFYSCSATLDLAREYEKTVLGRLRASRRYPFVPHFAWIFSLRAYLPLSSRETRVAHAKDSLRAVRRFERAYSHASRAVTMIFRGARDCDDSDRNERTAQLIIRLPAVIAILRIDLEQSRALRQRDSTPDIVRWYDSTILRNAAAESAPTSNGSAAAPVRRQFDDGYGDNANITVADNTVFSSRALVIADRTATENRKSDSGDIVCTRRFVMEKSED